jgi:hypothetical protein
MKKNITILFLILLASINTNAQLANGSISPDFTVNDLNGDSHNLYSYLDAGKTVFLDFSAVWCGPCWNYHTTHALKDVYEDHGPSGMSGVSQSTTNDVMVFFIEGQSASLAELNGGGSSLGDWVTGTPYPIICTDPASGLSNSTTICNDFDTPYWPTVYQVCPDRTITLIGQTQNLYSLVANCLPPPSNNNDARSFMNNSPSSGCSSVSPEISIQNYGLNNLTEVKIDVSLNGVLQYTTIFDEVYDNIAQSFQPLNLNTLELKNVVLDEIIGLVNDDIITIEVSMPNGIVDTDPSNDQEISYIVDLGFDNAYWDGPLSINVAGSPQNSWYLKQVSNNAIIASGFGNVTGVNNSFPLVFDECYTLQSINGANLPYTITDAMGQVLLDGSASSVEDFDNFSTGNQIWTGVVDSKKSRINVFPIPAKNKLYIDGKYDYLTIIDLLGNKIKRINYVNEAIDISNFKIGAYLLEFNSNGLKTYTNFQIIK